MKCFKRQRGYTLVEIAIVLTAALMMGSWVSVKYLQVQRDARVTETERTIENIKEAIVEYAASREVQSYVVVHESTSLTVSWRVPPGRPYLPCPDITNDGLEDRHPQPVPAGEQTLKSYWELRSNSSFQGCYRLKGLLPWKTLGTPPTDPWGNRYTYRVDPDFADALLGFDEQTTSDDSTPVGTSAILPPYEYDSAIGRIVHRGVKAPGSQINITPTAPNADVMVIWGANHRAEDAPSIICASTPCSYKSQDYAVSLVAGNIATAEITLSSDGIGKNLKTYALFDDENIISGLPVVIVSHGENGYGAVRGDVSGWNCGRPFPGPTSNRQAERQNAFINVAVGTCVASPPLDGGIARQNGFVYRDPSAGEAAAEYDDIVSWMSVEELRARLTRRGVFPAQKLPPFGLEGN